MLKAAATNPILDESSVLIDVLSRVGSYPDRIRIAAARSLRKWSRKIRCPTMLRPAAGAGCTGTKSGGPARRWRATGTRPRLAVHSGRSRTRGRARRVGCWRCRDRRARHISCTPPVLRYRTHRLRTAWSPCRRHRCSLRRPRPWARTRVCLRRSCKKWRRRTGLLRTGPGCWYDPGTPTDCLSRRPRQSRRAVADRSPERGHRVVPARAEAWAGIPRRSARQGQSSANRRRNPPPGPRSDRSPRLVPHTRWCCRVCKAWFPDGRSRPRGSKARRTIPRWPLARPCNARMRFHPGPPSKSR